MFGIHQNVQGPMVKHMTPTEDWRHSLEKFMPENATLGRVPQYWSPLLVWHLAGHVLPRHVDNLCNHADPTMSIKYYVHAYWIKRETRQCGWKKTLGNLLGSILWEPCVSILVDNCLYGPATEVKGRKKNICWSSCW